MGDRVVKRKKRVVTKAKLFKVISRRLYTVLSHCPLLGKNAIS